MKRVISLLAACVLLLGSAGCKSPADPAETYTPLEPLTYTGLPTELKAESLGTINRKASLTESGLVYTEEGKYGIMTPDGKVDSGAVYVDCEPQNEYFLVSKKSFSAADGIASINTVGVVDAAGKVRVPLAFAQVSMMDGRFARVVEVTGTTEDESQGVTYYLDENENKVHCTGTWYIYDMQTGKAVPGATGTTRYATYTYGSYVKYVTDDKQVVVSTPDGQTIPEEAVHLLNGYYVIEAENTLYDGDGKALFTYDPAGYVPCESKGLEGYVAAKKQVDGKDTYVLMDLTGSVVTAAFSAVPQVFGELLYVDGKLTSFSGDTVAEDFHVMYWETLYGQCWLTQKGTVRKAITKDGTVLYTGNETNPVLDVNQMLLYTTQDEKRVYYSVKDQDFTLTGVAVAPFIVKVPNGETYYDLVNVLTGETILSGYLDYKTKIIHGVLYVYANVSEGVNDAFAVR